jgi:hypothetical protein
MHIANTQPLVTMLAWLLLGNNLGDDLLRDDLKRQYSFSLLPSAPGDSRNGTSGQTGWGYPPCFFGTNSEWIAGKR